MLAVAAGRRSRASLFQYFEFTDRVAHVFWRLRDPQHPAYDAALAAKYGDAVEKSYETMDAIVGRGREGALAERRPDRALRSRLRDVAPLGQLQHAGSSRTATWCSRAAPSARASRRSSRAGSSGSRWTGRSRAPTRWAWATSTSTCRAARTAASSRRAPSTRRSATSSSAKLEALTDPEERRARRLAASSSASRSYRRFDPRLIPDLIVTNRPAYRVSWQSSLGVPTENVFEDNRDVWSGDHCSLDPDLVRGVLFSSRPVPREPGPGHRGRDGLGARSFSARTGRRRGGKVALVGRPDRRTAAGVRRG